MAEDLRLTVMASSIEGKGIVKIDPDSFEKLNLSDGMNVIVTYGAKSKEMSAKVDLIYGESTARLMNTDMDYLRVEEGMKIIVSKKNGSVKKEKPAAKKGKKSKKSVSNGKAASLDSF